MNVEKLIIDHINASAFGIHATQQVPADRTDEFVTVERVGGPRPQHWDRPLVVVQVWAGSRWDASEAAYELANVLDTLVDEPLVARVAIQSIVNLPDPESGQARYQITLDLVTV